jgi:hypothetical protein
MNDVRSQLERTRPFSLWGSYSGAGGSAMTKTRTAWLAFALLASVSVSAVVAMTAGTWQSPVAMDATPDQPDQSVAQVEPAAADDTLTKVANWPEVPSREAVDRPPPIILRGAELPADPPPAAPGPLPPSALGTMPPAAPGRITNPGRMTNIASRHWHDANGGIKMATASAQPMMGVNAQQIRRARDSKAEMRVKRSRAATNARACAPPSNAFAGLLRKLNLSPRCPA